MESLNLNTTYKTPTSVSLEWTFAQMPIYTHSYVAYYQSGGEGYSVAFTIDSLERDNRHELTGLPVGGVHSISLVALVDLPSPVAGPVTPGECIYILGSILIENIFSVVEAPLLVSVSGEGSGVAGTSYSLTCTVKRPLGMFITPNIQWKRPNMPFTSGLVTGTTSAGDQATLQLPSLQSSDAGEYLCQASYSLGGYTSQLINGSYTLNVIICKSTTAASNNYCYYAPQMPTPVTITD